MANNFKNLKPEEKKAAFLSLMMQPIGATRHKAIATIMSRRNLSFDEAKKLQALRILDITEEELPKLERPKMPKSNLGVPV